MFAVSPAGYISPYANSLSCTTSMQHIAIARAIYIDHDRLGEKHGRLSWRTIDYNDIHELSYCITKPWAQVVDAKQTRPSPVLRECGYTRLLDYWHAGRGVS